MKNYINPIRNTSLESVDDYMDESLDFVFIDGNHEYDFVFSDIKNWLPKVKRGGVLAGMTIMHLQ